MSVEQAEKLVASWRTEADSANPAGPLYTSGDYTEADILGVGMEMISGCSGCTASRTAMCC